MKKLDYYNFFSRLDMRENSTYYQRNKERLLEQAKQCYKKNKGRIKKQAKNKYRELSSEPKKNKIKKK